MNKPSIGGAPFFSSLPETDQARISQRMRLEPCRNGQVLFRKGDKSTALYLIESGVVRLLADGGIILANSGPGSLVGETDLFLERPHTLGATAVGDAQLWILTREDLFAVIAENPQTGVELGSVFGMRLPLLDQYLVQTRLTSLPCLAGTKPNTLSAVASRMVPVHKKAGEFIIPWGQPPEAMYVIESGRVQVHSSEGEDAVQTLGPGESLGETALLTRRPRAQSAQAASDVMLWALPAEELDALADEHPDLRLALKQNIRVPLSGEDKAQARERLAHVPLFAGQPDEVLKAVAERLVSRHVAAGELVFAAGTPGDALYVVETGQIEIVGPGKERGTPLATLGADEFFGEMALLTGQPRLSAARAATHSSLWMLHRSDFEDLVNRYPTIALALSRVLSQRLAEMDRRFGESGLRSIKLLAGLSSSQLEDVGRRIRPVTFRLGEVILHEGDPGDELYFIESGTVRVLREAGRQSRVLAELGPGDTFGEMALLTGNPRSATVTARSQVTGWAVAQEDFESLMASYSSLALALSRLLSDRLQSADERFTGAALPAAYAVERAVVPYRRTERQSRRAPAVARREPVFVQHEVPVARREPRRPIAAGLKASLEGATAWFGGLSSGAKVRLVLVSLLLVWLTCIALPALLISTLAAADVDDLRGAIAFVQTETPLSGTAALAQEVPAEAQAIAAPPPGAKALSVAPEALAEAVAAPEVQAMALAADPGQDASATPEPPTPEPATPTPWIIVVTNTPMPVTDTPTPEPTATPKPRAVVARSAAPPPPPTDVPPKPRPPRDLDPRLSALNVAIAEPGGLKPGQSYWRLMKAYWQNKEESGNDHTIYIEVLDENGSRIVGQAVDVRWADGSLTVFIEDKPAPVYGANFPMYGTLGSYAVSIPGLPSDQVQGMGMGTPDQPKFTIHTNFFLVFQRTKW